MNIKESASRATKQDGNRVPHGDTLMVFLIASPSGFEETLAAAHMSERWRQGEVSCRQPDAQVRPLLATICIDKRQHQVCIDVCVYLCNVT